MSEALSSATMAQAMESARQAALDAPKNAAGTNVDAAAGEFESMFLSQMLAPMWDGLEADGEFDGGSAELTFRSMLINEYGKTLAKSGGFGIGAQVKAEMIRMQERT